MKYTPLILSGLAGIALFLTACKSESTTEVTPTSDAPALSADAAEIETVSLNVSGMT